MRNVALIVLDTVRKDSFDEHAQRLQTLADVSFERCYAPSSWSVPSHSSIFTGHLPHQHGVHSHNPDYRSLGSTFWDDLPHRSIGVSANGAVSEALGADALFDEFHSFAGNDELTPGAMSFTEIPDDATGAHRYLSYLDRARRQGKLTPSLLNGLYVKLSDFLSGKPVARPGDFGAERLIRSSLGRVEQAGKPFVLFNNFIDAHGPMENLRCLDSDVDAAWTSTALSDDELRDAPEEYEDDLENYRELYAANVEYLDEKVAEYVEALQARTDGETTVIVTADHGDELLLDRERDVGHSDFSNALLHVPFVVINAEGEDVTEPTTLLDVDRIVHSLVEDGTVPDVTRDLVPAERLGMLFYDGNDEYWRRAVRTVYQDDGRYEWDSLGEEAWLEVSTSADGERTETEIPDRIRAQFDSDLHAYLDEQRASATTVDVSRETENRLENLGYKV